jgi:hypothetical protein
MMFCLLKELAFCVFSEVIPPCSSALLIPADLTELLSHKISINAHTPESPKFSFDNTSLVRHERDNSGLKNPIPVALKQFSLKSSKSILHGMSELSANCRRILHPSLPQKKSLSTK